jgi:predicted molibdopterin-dependent oxidoreductase YjgC
VQRVRQAIPPLAGSKPDWQVFIALAARFGYDLPYRHPSQIMDEIAAVVPSYAGISYRRIEQAGLHWPVPSADHPGTPTLHLEQFATPSGRARFLPARSVQPSAPTDERFPIVLQIATSLDHWDTGERTRRAHGPMLLEPEPALLLSTSDAARAAVRDGDLVEVASRRGAFALRAQIANGLPAGVARLNSHWPREAPFGQIVSTATEATTGTPEFKYTAVRVTRTPEGSLMGGLAADK